VCPMQGSNFTIRRAFHRSWNFVDVIKPLVRLILSQSGRRCIESEGINPAHLLTNRGADASPAATSISEVCQAVVCAVGAGQISAQ
jgi:hypothetical protein